MHTQAMEAWNHVCPDILHTPYYARSITSIMPGQTWRDTGHKAPYARCQCRSRLSPSTDSAPSSLPLRKCGRVGKLGPVKLGIVARAAYAAAVRPHPLVKSRCTPRTNALKCALESLRSRGIVSALRV